MTVFVRHALWLAPLALGIVCGVALVTAVGAEEKPLPDRAKLEAAMNSGNYKDAYEGFRALALNPQSDPLLVGADLQSATRCLDALGRTEEIDDFREAVVAAHPNNWRLLRAAAVDLTQHPHFGQIVAGKFVRGPRRGGGEQPRTRPRA
jgi:hypothetical protein